MSDWPAGLRIGHAEDEDRCTGCTVLIGPFRGAVLPLGGATGTRELHALQPTHIAERVDALLLTGGSAFGLAAADGVAAWLEERGAGFETGVARVPIVPAAVIFDLAVGDPAHRPGPALGRAACEAASDRAPAEGRVGAGAGATVGKLLGIAGAAPGGVGVASTRVLDWSLTALVVVNAFGDVLDRHGRILAGARRPDGTLLDTAAALARGEIPASTFSAAAQGLNTTLAVVVTDAPLGRAPLLALAAAAAPGLARRICPVFTPFDGDLVFTLSTAPAEHALAPAVLLALGSTAAELIGHAVERAVAPKRS